jgi:hypothetical protein
MGHKWNNLNQIWALSPEPDPWADILDIPMKFDNYQPVQIVEAGRVMVKVGVKNG